MGLATEDLCWLLLLVKAGKIWAHLSQLLESGNNLMAEEAPRILEKQGA